MLKSVQSFRAQLYDRAVARTLAIYENWILPDPAEHGFARTTRISLREAKLREFREKKKLLHPYEREQLLDSASQEERLRLTAVDKRTNFASTKDFKVTYNRHKDAYDFRVSNFPKEYHLNASPLDFRHDPDLVGNDVYDSKFKLKRVNLKMWMIAGLLTYWLIGWKVKRVENFDRMKRKE